MGRPGFAELLDEKLREMMDAVGAAPPVTNNPVPVVPAHPLLFAAAYRSGRGARYATHDAPAAGPNPHHFGEFDDLLDEDGAADRCPSQRQTSARAHRQLAAAETDALTILNRLGARLGPDFTPRELRTAFRALARRFHPDCHQTSDRADRMRASRLFVLATQHHRTLLQVIAREMQPAGVGV